MTEQTDAIIGRLDEIIQAIPAVDPMLDQLVDIATGNIPVQYGVVLLLGDVQIEGVPVSAHGMADRLDYLTGRFFGFVIDQAKADPTVEHDAEWYAALEQVASSTFFRSRVQYWDDFREKMAESTRDISFKDMTELPVELRRDVSKWLSQHTAVTLQQATVRQSGADPVHVPLIRVALSQIKAWWPFELGDPNVVDA
jgi:hypothetical protein